MTSLSPVRNLGGKLGTQIAEHFKTESLVELLHVSLGQFQVLLPDDTATYVYNVIRGVERSPVAARLSIKSMLSAKSFRNPLPASLADAQPWLKVFIADISSRMEDEWATEGGPRRPKSMTLHFSSKVGGSRSRRTRVPPAGRMDAEMLLGVADGLLKLVAGGNVWPCTRMSLQVDGFEGREEGNMGIGAFLVKAQKRPLSPAAADDDDDEEEGGAAGEEMEEEGGGRNHEKREKKNKWEGGHRQGNGGPVLKEGGEEEAEEDFDADAPTAHCPDCDAEIAIGGEEEHKDWHFAKALVDKDRAVAAREREAQRPLSAIPPRGGGGGAKKKTKKTRKDSSSKAEKGQTKLSW